MQSFKKVVLTFYYKSKVYVSKFDTPDTWTDQQITDYYTKEAGKCDCIRSVLVGVEVPFQPLKCGNTIHLNNLTIDGVEVLERCNLHCETSTCEEKCQYPLGHVPPCDRPCLC